MTEEDVRNYLEKIYKLPVAEVRSTIHHGEMPLGKGRTYLVKKPDYRVCFVSLPIGTTFKHPGDDLFQPMGECPTSTDISKTMESVKVVQKKFKDKTWKSGPNMPTWWTTSST